MVEMVVVMTELGTETGATVEAGAIEMIEECPDVMLGAMTMTDHREGIEISSRVAWIEIAEAAVVVDLREATGTNL